MQSTSSGVFKLTYASALLLVFMTSVLSENYRSNAQLVEFAKTIGYPSNLSAIYPDTSIHRRTPIAVLQNSLPSGLLWSTAWSKVLDPALPAVALLHEDDLLVAEQRI